MGSKVLSGGITPLHIGISLHYFNSQDSGAVAYKGLNSDAAVQVHHELADAGLLEFAGKDKRWKATDRMRQYVESLCRVPLPIKQEERPSDIISHLDTFLNNKNGTVGDNTINTKIAAVMDEYVTIAPQAKL